MNFINKKSVITLACFSSIFLAVAINGALSANQEQMPPPPAKTQYPVVSVSLAHLVSHQGMVSAYGEVTSRNNLSLTSQVSGKVTNLSSTFLTGNTFKKGDVIAQLETIEYQQALANANASLADAKLALAQEALNASQAEQEWQQSGLAQTQASDLVLRKPQLQAANAKFNQAQQAVEKAKYDLNQTTIIAPFDALIVTKSIQMGSNVQAGVELAMIYDTSLFEVNLPLSQHQWQLLPSNLAQSVQSLSEVTLSDDANRQQWQASVNRVEQHVDAKSRQRSLVVNIDNPLALEQPLFPGTFVKATVYGAQIDNLWKLPASALINNNTVWQITDDNLLNLLDVEIIFSQGNSVFVKPITNIDNAQIVNRPLSSYLVNMKVVPIIEEIL